ncbi:MAG: hypothetical protein IBX50_11870 [Marinospirillum sp.]|uniref:hypothetical protein n=1 Tax=Marinospirillum sp. TaxID=2183934 RepID=UPI0019EB161B|nr:hypothetical protein [Marinospirillum sp.]MBE0507396.1 hypothetical protein [Marinospirillum sp.]
MIHHDTLKSLGFKFGKNGTHASRTLMFSEINKLFSALPSSASPEQYRQDIVQFNLLHKPTEKARLLTWRHLTSLYSMDTRIPLFRVFRRYWDADEQGRALLACQIGLARDPLLHLSMDKILDLEPGQWLPREEMEQFFSERCPDRFSPATLKSIAQNVNGTWTTAGFLQGRAKKYQSVPAIRPVNLAFALFMGLLHGLTGQRLFNTEWTRLLNCRPEQMMELARQASQAGLLRLKHSSDVVEITFPEYLTKEEETWLNE